MKKIITFVLVALASVASFAANITCAEAVSIAQGLEPNTPSTETYTVEGYVISVIKPSATDLRFWMADSLNVEAGIFEAWMCTGEVVKKGDKVTVTGNLQWYVNQNNPNEQMAEIYGGTIVIVEAAPIDENYVEFYPFDFEGKGVSGTGGEISVTKNGVTVYTNGGYGSSYSLRVYRNKQLKISSTKRIVSIAFEFDNYDGDYSGGLDPEVCVGGTEWEVTAIASLGRFKKISVTLGDGQCSITPPVVDTITVAQAIEIGNALGDNASTTEKYYVEGIVKKAYDYDEIFKNQTFYLIDNAGDEAELLAKYATGSVVTEGDRVCVSGKIEKNVRDNQITIQIYKGFAEVISHELYTLTLYTDIIKGTVSGAGKYIKGDICTLTATANYGYHFTQWSDGNTDNPRTIQIVSDTTFTAEFAKNIYTISVEAEHGSVAGGGDYEYLSNVQLTATANEHYHFVRWDDWNTENPRTITVEGDKTYTAIFSIDQHTISAYAEHGRVSGIGTYSYGTNVTLTVIPDIGYEFSNWSDGNTDNPRIVSVTKDETYNCICTQMTAGKCGNNLYWEYKEGKLIFTGMGEMYDYAANEMPWYLYRDNVQHVEFSAGLTYIGCNAFANFIRIEEITCFANQSPRVCSTTFDGLSKQYIYLYVPADYIRSYQVNPSWNVFDIRTKSADVKPMDDENPVVTPTDQDVTITWPIIDGTDTYTLTITKNGEVVCVLTFNANGQLINIAFAAPGHNGARQAPTATLTAQGYQFTVTGLNPGTTYDYRVTATDAGGKTLAEHKGNFSTTSGESSLESVHDSQCTMHKYFHNGNLIIERNGVKYTPAGQKVQ